MSCIDIARRHNKRDRLIQRDGVRCHWCEEPFGFDHPMTFEHLIPLVYGGSSDDHNLVLACARCNTDRHHLARCEGCGHRIRRDGVAWNPTTWHTRCLKPTREDPSHDRCRRRERPMESEAQPGS